MRVRVNSYYSECSFSQEQAWCPRNSLNDRDNTPLTLLICFSNLKVTGTAILWLAEPFSFWHMGGALPGEGPGTLWATYLKKPGRGSRPHKTHKKGWKQTGKPASASLSLCSRTQARSSHLETQTLSGLPSCLLTGNSLLLLVGMEIPLLLWPPVIPTSLLHLVVHSNYYNSFFLPSPLVNQLKAKRSLKMLCHFGILYKVS